MKVWMNLKSHTYQVSIILVTNSSFNFKVLGNGDSIRRLLYRHEPVLLTTTSLRQDSILILLIGKWHPSRRSTAYDTEYLKPANAT